MQQLTSWANTSLHLILLKNFILLSIYLSLCQKSHCYDHIEEDFDSSCYCVNENVSNVKADVARRHFVE